MTSELTQKVYHEKQKRQLCLLHTLNNLFQKKEFTQMELDAICERFIFIPIVKVKNQSFFFFYFI